MYENFTSSSLNEYYKIIKTINSIILENIDIDLFSEYYNVIYNMTLTFANNLDYRNHKLKVACIKGLNIYNRIRDWRRYKLFSTLLITELTNELESLANNAKTFYEDSDTESRRIQVRGFIE